MPQPTASTSVSANNGGGTTSVTFAFTSTGKPMTVQAGIGSSLLADRNSYTVTYGGVSLTLLPSSRGDDTNFEACAMFYLLAPTAGTANVVVSAANPVQLGAGAQEWTNLNPVTPFGTAVNNGSPTGGSIATSSLTPTANDMVMVALSTDSSGAATPITGGTNLWNENNVAGDSCFEGASITGTGASVTPTGTGIGGNVGGAISAVILFGSGISVDDTVVRWTGAPVDGTPITSGAFTPPNNSVLVVVVNADTTSSAGGVNITVSGGGLTWVQKAESDAGTGSGQEGHVSIHRAVVGTGASMTIDVARTGSSTSRVSCKVYIVTGASTVSPDGQTATGGSTTDNISPSLTTLANGRLFGGATDWGQTASDPSSTDIEDAAHYVGNISCLSAYKSADHTSGTSQSINFDSIGASPNWNYALYEVRVAAAPTIDTQPRTQTVVTNAVATFTVAATTSGGTLHYQWKKNGSNVGTDSNSYAITATDSDNLSVITVDVTDDNGSVTSTSVYLVVVAAEPFGWFTA